MTLSRRSTIKTIGVVGAGSALTGSALAVSEHDDDERDSEEAPADDEEVGAIRVGHFSPDAPNVDVYVDDQQILSDVGYDELSPYLEIVPGTYTVTITAAGEDEPVYERTIAVDAEYYTAAAIGELEGEPEPEAEAEAEDGVADDADGDDYDENGLEDETDEDDQETGTFEIVLLVDAGPEDIEEGTSRIRVVHASPDAPDVDIADAETGAPIFEDVGFTEPSGYVPVGPGARTLDIFEAGSGDLDADDETGLEDDEDQENDGMGVDDEDGEDDDDAIEDDVIDQPEPVASVELDLEENTAYTAYAIGYIEELEDEEITVEEDEHLDEETDNGDYDENDVDEDLAEEDDDYDDENGLEEDYDDDDEDVGVDDEDNLEDDDERPFTVRVAVDGETDEADPDADETDAEDDYDDEGLADADEDDDLPTDDESDGYDENGTAAADD